MHGHRTEKTACRSNRKRARAGERAEGGERVLGCQYGTGGIGDKDEGNRGLVGRGSPARADRSSRGPPRASPRVWTHRDTPGHVGTRRDRPRLPFLPCRSPSRAGQGKGREQNPEWYETPTASATTSTPFPTDDDLYTTLPSDRAFPPANRRQIKNSLPGSDSSPGGDGRTGKRQRASNHREYVKIENV